MAIEYTDLEVRNHQTCKHHQLRYKGVSWEFQGDTHEFQPLTQGLDGCDTIRGQPRVESCGSTDSVPFFSIGMDRDRDAISENVTRNIFGWLRRDGYAPNEADIWKHEWFEPCDSDEDEANGDKSTSSERHQTSTQVLAWLSNLRSEDEVSDDDAPNGYGLWSNVGFDDDGIGAGCITDGERLQGSRSEMYDQTYLSQRLDDPIDDSHGL
jgi:hypothetical protein